MKNLLILLCVTLVNPCLAVRARIKKNKKKIVVEKTTHKRLVKNHQTGAIALVDSTESADAQLHSSAYKGRPDWKALIAFQNQTIDSHDPEIELTQVIDAHNNSSSVDWNAVAAYVCQPGRIAQIVSK